MLPSDPAMRLPLRCTVAAAAVTAAAAAAAAAARHPACNHFVAPSFLCPTSAAGMGYGEAPWDFRGRALYQLSLVRVEEVRGQREERGGWCQSHRLYHLRRRAGPARSPWFGCYLQCKTGRAQHAYTHAFAIALLLSHPPQARKYVPAELPLVSFFGWTLGGFYLARYSGGRGGSLRSSAGHDARDALGWAARAARGSHCVRCLLPLRGHAPWQHGSAA